MWSGCATKASPKRKQTVWSTLKSIQQPEQQRQMILFSLGGNQIMCSSGPRGIFVQNGNRFHFIFVPFMYRYRHLLAFHVIYCHFQKKVSYTGILVVHILRQAFMIKAGKLFCLYVHRVRICKWIREHVIVPGLYSKNHVDGAFSVLVQSERCIDSIKQKSNFH